MLPPIFLSRPGEKLREVHGARDRPEVKVYLGHSHVDLSKTSMENSDQAGDSRDRREAIATLSRQIGNANTQAQLRMSASNTSLNSLDGTQKLRWRICTGVEEFLESLSCLSYTLSADELVKLGMRATALHTDLLLHLEAAKLSISLEDRKLMREIQTKCHTVQVLINDLANQADDTGQQAEAQRRRKLSDLCDVVKEAKAFLEAKLKPIYKYCSPMRTKASRGAMAVVRSLKRSIVKPILNVPTAIVERIGGDSYVANARESQSRDACDIEMVFTPTDLKKLQKASEEIRNTESHEANTESGEHRDSTESNPRESRPTTTGSDELILP